MDEGVKLYHGDSLRIMQQIPNSSIDLVLTDPPYNIGVKTLIDRRKIANDWDRIDNYIDWCISWLLECQRVLKPNGVLYFWHNDMAQIAELLVRIKAETDLEFVSFCIWDKGGAYRPQTWRNRRLDSQSAPRSWFNICEYCLHFFNNPQIAGGRLSATGLERINSSPESYKPLKEWYAAEMERLGLTKQDIAAKYTAVTGRKPYMVYRHYFNNNQFELPTQEAWESVYVPLGFGQSYEDLRRSYEELKQSCEGIRQSYEEQRNTHICDPEHCNVWHVPPIPSNKRYHTCQKPVEILERLARVSSRPGGVILDPFMGSGSTGVAAVNTGRRFIGIEKEEKYFKIAKQRIGEAETMRALAYTE